MKKFAILFLLFALISGSTLAYADFSDVDSTMAYADAVHRVSSLGLIEGVSADSFKPLSAVTRKDFAVMLVKVAGLQETAEAIQEPAPFPDVDPKGKTSGYIRIAVDKGYLTGMADGKFHPGDSVTYAQACTALVKVLGYSEGDVTGLWPRSFINKAAGLGLTKGISLKNGDAVPRWAMAVMLDRLLGTAMKKSAPADAEKTLADVSGLYSECIILGNSLTSDKLSENQIQTDKGIFYLEDPGLKLELGNTYRLSLDGDTIKRAYDMMNQVENISVDSVTGTRISYRTDNGVEYKTLPDKTQYYYKGAKINYDEMKNILQTRSSIVLACNSDKSGYTYGVIYDPVYSSPEVARSFQPSSGRLGALDMRGSPVVVRNGELSDVLQIQEKDVVYRVSDIWGRYGYILAMDNRVGGVLTGILPNKVSPKTLQIDGKDYEISSTVDAGLLNYSPGSFKVDDQVVALLGFDGKIVDLEYPGSENNSSFALVLNASSKITTNTNGTLTYTYYAKLMTSDGITATYDVGTDVSRYKGALVQFERIDNQKVKIDPIPYNYPQQVTVNKLDRLISGSYAADNMKIFNIVSRDDGDVQASMLDFKDLPEGTIPNGKVYHLNKTGAFEDVNLLVTNDILNERYKTGIIKSMTASKGQNGVYSYTYTILVEGKEYQYRENYINNSDIGAVLPVEMTADGIGTVIDAEKPAVTAASVQAFDAKRIKVNDKVLWFNKDIAVYFLDYAGNVTVKSIANLNVNLLYGSVSIYLDQSDDQRGKVDAIVVKQ